MDSKGSQDKQCNSDPAEGESEKRDSPSNVTQIDNKTGMQIKEALQMQLDAQRLIHEEVEIQRKLQLRIEEQSKKLKMIFDQQQKTNWSLLEAQNSSISSRGNDPSTQHDEIESLVAERSENAHLP